MRLPLPTLVVSVSALVAGLFLATQVRRLYFFGDDWAFLLHRTISWSDLMRPHNEHWSALPVIAYRAMFRIFGVDHYLAYAMMPVLLHLAAALALYALMRRNEIAAWPAAVVTVPFLFLAGDIGENPLWAFQIGFLGSAVLALAALHLAHGDSRRATAAAWGASVLSLLCSGMALPLLVWLGAYVLLRRGLRQALVQTVPPLLVYGLWYLTYGNDAVTSIPDPTASQVVEFVAVGPTAAWQAFLRLPASGTLAIVVLTLFVLMARLTDRQRALAMGGMLTLAAAYLALATSRGGFGPEAAGASRYSYFALLYSLPAFALVLTEIGVRLQPRPGQRLVAAALLVLALVGNGVVQTLAFADGRAALTEGLRGQLLGTKRLIEDDATILENNASLPLNPDFTVDALSRPAVLDALPDEAPGPVGTLDAALGAQVTTSRTSLGHAAPSQLRRHQLAGSVAAGGCAELEARAGAWLEIPGSATVAEVSLTTQAPSLSLRMVSDGRASRPRTITTTPGVPFFLASASEVGRLRVQLPRGPVDLCLPGSASVPAPG